MPKDFRAPGIAASRLTASEFKSHAAATWPANVAKKQRDVAWQQQEEEARWGDALLIADWRRRVICPLSFAVSPLPLFPSSFCILPSVPILTLDS
ncbi:MAG TPA: hypothetical protein VGX78_17870 [Pirellulales bacterium]|nr:hypothetical protein [Pirellulales bacterium]